MMTQGDIRERLEQARQRLANAAREMDAAAVHVRVLLDGVPPARGQAPYTPKPVNDEGDRTDGED